MDWQSLFAVNVPPFEIFVRGTLIYWFLFGVFRFVLHRDVGGLGIADLLLLVLVADAAQNAMAGDYQSISEGLILVTTIIGWNTLLDLMAYHFPLIAEFAEPRKLCLVRHGRVLHKSLRQELLTTEDVMMKLREHGIEELAQVKHAYMESDGEVSVIKYRERS